MGNQRVLIAHFILVDFLAASPHTYTRLSLAGIATTATQSPLVT
jgi:hypothetical protein